MMKKNIYEECRSGHVTCGVWGWISMDGVGDVVRIDGRLTAEKYVRILEEYLLPSLRERNFHAHHRPIIFVQDKSPIHTARVVREWFANQNVLQLLDWPIRGCDMNPIEHVWANMVNTWDPANERTPQTLMDHVNRSWEGLRRKPWIIRAMVASMPDRLAEVYEKEGGWSHY